MLRLKKQGGFTLVEIVITLAIAGLLIPIIFTGQREIRDRQQFSDAVERVKNNVITAKNEAFTTVNARDEGGDPGKDPTTYVWGKYVLFASESDRVQVTTLIRSTSNPSDIREGDSYDFTIPNQVVNTDPQDAASRGLYIIFTRDPDNGRLDTWVPEGAANPMDIADYTEDARTRSQDFCFRDQTNHYGCVIVDARTSTVTRRID